MYINVKNLSGVCYATVPIIKDLANKEGVDLNAIVVCYRIEGDKDTYLRKFSIDNDENSMAAAFTVTTYAKGTYEHNIERFGKSFPFTEMNAEAFLFEEDSSGGTGLYFPIVTLGRMTNGQVKPVGVSAYFGIGIVTGGNQEQNKRVLLSTIPTIFTEIKACDKLFSLPKALSPKNLVAYISSC